MSLVIEPLAVPIRLDDHGVARIGGTRVTLDVVLGEFHQGATPEQIVQDFDSLKLVDVYVVLAYYLRNKAQVAAYLEEQERQAQEIRRQIEARFPPDGIRERLLARRKQQA